MLIDTLLNGPKWQEESWQMLVATELAPEHGGVTDEGLTAALAQDASRVAKLQPHHDNVT